MSIQNYWSQIVLLPNRIISGIYRVCRAFLWRGSAEFGGPGVLAWDKFCQPKNRGGLGFRNLMIWNKAAIFKHIWAIFVEKDSLWMQWIHHIYLKDGNVWEHEALGNSCWNWKKLMAVKIEVKGLFQEAFTETYTIAK